MNFRLWQMAPVVWLCPSVVLFRHLYQWLSFLCVCFILVSLLPVQYVVTPVICPGPVLFRVCTCAVNSQVTWPEIVRRLGVRLVPVPLCLYHPLFQHLYQYLYHLPFLKLFIRLHLCRLPYHCPHPSLHFRPLLFYPHCRSFLQCLRQLCLLMSLLRMERSPILCPHRLRSLSPLRQLCFRLFLFPFLSRFQCPLLMLSCLLLLVFFLFRNL